MLGFDSKEEALDAYNRAFPDGSAQSRIGGVAEVPVSFFKEWVESNAKKKRPVSGGGGAEIRPAAARYSAEPIPPPEEGAPPTPPEGPTEGKPPEFPINLDRIGVDQSVKSLEGQIVDGLREKMGKAKGYRSWAEAREKALASGLTEADFHRLLKEKGSLSDHEIEAGRIMREEAGKAAHRSLEELRLQEVKATQGEATDEQVLEARKKYDADVARFSAIAYDTVGAGAEAARALAIHRKLSEGLLPEERFMRQILQKGKADSPEFRAKLADAVTRGDTKAMSELAREAYKPSWSDKWIEYYINSILSGPPTIIGNVMSNVGYESMVRTPERAISGAVDASVRPWLEKWLSKDKHEIAKQERFAREGYEAMRSMASQRFGVPAVARAIWDSVLNEKSEAEMLMSGKVGEGKVPAIPGKIGKVVRTPTRVMSWSDAAAKATASQNELVVQAFRRATIEGRNKGFTPQQFEARSAEIMKGMGDWVIANNLKKAGQVLSKEQYATLRDPVYSSIGSAMERSAAKATFTDQATALSRGLVALRKKYPSLYLIAPFINTPERILAAGFERTPVAFLKTLYDVREGKLKGGEISDQLAKQVYGTAMMALFTMAASDGFVTGSGPSDPDENAAWRATGAQPYSVKIGNSWVSYKRIEPIATVMSLAGDMVESKNEKDSRKLAEKLQGAVLENISNKTWLQGVVNFAEMWSDPKRYASQFFKGVEGAVVPNVVAKLAQEIDPTVRQTSATDLSAIAARVPGVSRYLQPKLRDTGEPIEREGLPGERLISPFPRTERKGEEADLERAFLESGYTPNPPQRFLTIPGTHGMRVDLKQDEINLLSDVNRRVTARARELAKDPRFKALDPEDKKAYLQRLYNAAMSAARKQLTASPEMVQRMREAIREQRGAERPQWAT